MDPERWSKVKEIFQSALDLPPAERRPYAREASGGDEELLREVESLLDSDESSQDFLAESADQYVPGVLEDPEPPDANIGRRIGPYQIVREIGAGGMGAVYLAERVDEFRQKAALKLMRPGLNSRMVQSRFRHERQILAGLDHPHIARLLDGGATDDGRPYFVMEYVEGIPIDQYCSRRALAIDDRLRLFQRVCSAVQYAHQNLVVHRDLKPGNILVGEDGSPKLLDFGIAKLLGPAPASDTSRMTELGMRLMTPEYASPEQARGLPVTTATDVYSLGVVFYELITGRMPYSVETRSPAERERIICETDPLPPGAIDPRLSGDLQSICLKALEKEPQRRYNSVEQFSEDIRRRLESLPVVARPQTLMYRANRFVRRNRTAVAAGLLVVLSLAAGLIATAWEAHIARQQRARAERRFNQVRHLAESFLFEFHDQIKDLAGATPARKLVVQRAQELLASLSQEAAGEPSLERELAEAYIKVGDVQGNPYVSGSRDTAGALASYKKAQEIAAAVTRRYPQDAEAIRDLAHARRATAEVLPLRGDTTGALQQYREAIALLEPLTPTNPDARFELGQTYEVMGDLLGHSGLVNLGDPEGARKAYGQALRVYEETLRRQPGNTRAQRANAITHMKIGDLDLDARRLDAALAEYQGSAKVFEDFLRGDPNNAEALRTLSQIERKIGGAYESKEMIQPAFDQYFKASQIQRQLADADKTNTRAALDYAGSRYAIANMFAGHDEPRRALPFYRDLLGVVQPLSEAEPGDTRLRLEYADALVYTGDCLLKLNQKEEGLRLYRQGLAIEKQLADRPGATPEEISDYAENVFTGHSPEVKNAAEGVKYARRGAEMTHLAQFDSVDQLARAYAELGDMANAVLWEEKAIALLPQSPARQAAEKRLAEWRKKKR